MIGIGTSSEAGNSRSFRSHAAHCGFGRSVLVVDFDRMGNSFCDIASQPGLEVLAAHDELAQSCGLKIAVADHCEMRRGQLHNIDGIVVDDLKHDQALHSGITEIDHDAAAGDEWREERRDGQVESEG